MLIIIIFQGEGEAVNCWKLSAIRNSAFKGREVVLF